jgi:hypothetical protein
MPPPGESQHFEALETSNPFSQLCSNCLERVPPLFWTNPYPSQTCPSEIPMLTAILIVYHVYVPKNILEDRRINRIAPFWEHHPTEINWMIFPASLPWDCPIYINQKS